MSARGHLRLVASTPANPAKAKRNAAARARREVASRMLILGSLEELIGEQDKVHVHVLRALEAEAVGLSADPKTIDLLREYVARLHLHASRYEREWKRLSTRIAGGGC